MGLKKSRCFCK